MARFRQVTVPQEAASHSKAFGPVRMAACQVGKDSLDMPFKLAHHNFRYSSAAQRQKAYGADVHGELQAAMRHVPQERGLSARPTGSVWIHAACKEATKMEPCVLTTPLTTAPSGCPSPACWRCFTSTLEHIKPCLGAKSTGTRQTPAANSPRIEATRPMPQ